MGGVPLDSGLQTPSEELPDPFMEFNSVTLHHDGDEGFMVHDEPVQKWSRKR
jgi:protein-serine/threonine kinase